MRARPAVGPVGPDTVVAVVTDHKPAEPDAEVDWRFVSRPFWLFSHVFAGSVVVLFIGLGLWQLDRLGQRQEQNELIQARVDEPIQLSGAPDAGEDGSELDYRSASVVGVILDEDFVRVGNRSQGGVAGEHVVAIIELADGSPLAVNRGFVPANTDVDLEPMATGPITGWLRATVERESIGATDTGESDILPRFDTERIGFRLGQDLPPVWLQVAPIDGTGQATFPDPVPLPPLDDGPHLSYAVQWFIFATLGVLFYGALLRRQARGDRRVRVTAQPIED